MKRKPASQKKGECGFSSPEPDNQDSSGSEGRKRCICIQK